MARTTKRKPLSRSERLRIFVSSIAAVAMLAAAAAMWYFRDSLFSGEGSTLSAAQTQTQATYSFDPGNNPCYAMVGKLLAVGTNSGYSLLSPDGTAISSQNASLDSPAVVSCADYAAFFDTDGQTLYFLGADGSASQYDCGGNILSVRCGTSGHLAAVSRQAGYRAVVTVLNPAHEPIYRWYSSENYVLSAHVSPDGRKLAVLCLTTGGSEVKFFSLASDTQLAAFSVSDTILLDICWLSGEKLGAVSADRAVFFTSGGEWAGAYDFAGRYLTAYDAGSSFLCFALSPYRSGSGATVVTVDPSGKELSSTEYAGEILSIDAAGNEFLVLDTACATLYGTNGAKRGTLSDVGGFKQALIRNKGEALLVAAGFAEVYKF